MSIVKIFVTVGVQFINSALEISHCLIINVILLSLFMRKLGYYPENAYDCFKIVNVILLSLFMGKLGYCPQNAYDCFKIFSLLEIDALLGHYATYSGNCLLTFRRNLSAQSSRVKKSKKKAIEP